jgi:hypothetical protein
MSEEVTNILNDEAQTGNKVASNFKCQFAASRIKTIMKMDPEMNLSSKESVFLVSKATVSH